ncbi:MAG: 4-hydroxy-tetrahydrodipicolinate reductase [Archaeoglobaceae archaeon]|nr:4-hydroxy-tetrahydrodipicolinate reductase [Archaeoglobaceae archaeon]MDW7989932.1 4-hydroxy-tetrahydrodipicolinate reductase [Archaeoglobaceae archaeon]
MKLAISGSAGRMGKLVVKHAINKNLKLVQAFDVVHVGKDVGEVAGIGNVGVKIENDIEKLNADVLIDFTTPEACLKNAKVAALKGIKIVIGTTGFNEKERKELEEICRKVPSIISPNFSIGVNVFFKIVEFTASLLNNYDVEIFEIHHRHKKDSPSGTAIRIAEIIREVLARKGKDLEMIFYRKGKKGEDLGIFGLRGGDVVGEHTVLFFGEGERVELTHRATSRDCFAMGALIAAEWISKVDKPGIYSMIDVIGLNRWSNL